MTRLPIHDSILIDKAMIRALGTEASILVGFMILRSKEHNNCFVYTHGEIETDLGIKPYTSKRIIKNMVDKGVIRIQQKGVPCKYYYSFNFKALDSLLEGKFHE